MKRVALVLYLLLALNPAIIRAYQASDHWSESVDTDKITDSKTIYMFLIADGEVFKLKNWSSKNFPRLAIGCSDGRNFFSVVVPSAPKSDQSGNSPVIWRFGSFKPGEENWEVGDGSNILTNSTSPINSAASLTKVDKFTFRYTQKDGQEITLQFSVAGVKNHLPKIARACGWDYDKAVAEVR